MVFVATPAMAWFEVADEEAISTLTAIENVRVVAFEDGVSCLQGNVRYETHEGLVAFRGFMEVLLTDPDSVRITSFTVYTFDKSGELIPLPYNPLGFGVGRDNFPRRGMFRRILRFLAIIGHRVEDTTTSGEFSFAHSGREPSTTFVLPRQKQPVEPGG